MSDGLFSSVELGGGPAGFRLHRLEVLNWGTFHRQVWRLTTGGRTSLLTGDIGSGKSTLVDAITTLLLPAHRIAYNKAAGAEARERTLRSYVEGHHKTERVESTGALRPIGLRDHHSYSVILGVFVNEGYDETVTLAQVFHQTDRAGQPERFYVTCDKALSIAADFSDFGEDLLDLRRRLRAGGSEVHTVFPDYGRQMRRLLGIRSEQAMELFGQTVSMKSVGNLNDFVRRHMLEPADAADRVRGIVAHFEDLVAAHDAVRRAREQLEVLGPLVESADRYDDALARRSAAERERDAVRLFVAELRAALLDEAIAVHRRDLAEVTAQVERAEAAQAELGAARDALVEQRARAGGDRLGELERRVREARELASARRTRRERFDARAADAGLDAVVDEAGFDALAGSLGARSDELVAARGEMDGRITAEAGRRADTERRRDETSAELASLDGRTSNLPADLVALRAELAAHLAVAEADVPFAGELVDVADEHADWRGAAERVLRGFALSLLVPDALYARVVAWVNSRRLTYRRADGRTAGVRLVYERVSERRVPLRRAEGGGLLLADCMAVKDGPFADYLCDELIRRADHRCVDSLDRFRDEARAVTREGQVKAGDRHEKDDRTRVDDPRTWVLGWVNERKVEALRGQLAAQDAELADLDRSLTALHDERNAVTARLNAMAALAEYTGWAELDWAAAEAKAQDADDERARLVAGSSALAEIDRRIAEADVQAEDLRDALKDLNARIGHLKGEISRATRDLEADRVFVASHPDADGARAAFPGLRDRLGDRVPVTVEGCAAASDTLASSLHNALDRLGRELSTHSAALLNAMNEVRRRWPEATTEADAAVEARGAYRDIHRRVADDDLPRFEKEFARQLTTNAINELAGFNNWLRRQADDIGARVRRINDALGAIDYSPGRSITLLAERTDNREIADFRSELRSITDDSLTAGDDQYTEQRFADVRRIIERFRGRESHAEADKAWTARVTDVRNWFVFSASERDRVTDAEWEHYRDSDGKSGGQKEKLAYTILAASLAYQFGLEWGARRSKDFRFVVIDEAFGRGSDASTRYALELFAKLGLQLLIVTPLQKVHVIEPFVHAIGFVDNPEGNASRLQTLTIEEYRARRDGRER
jgi:uncharacterized protein YPO0396